MQQARNKKREARSEKREARSEKKGFLSDSQIHWVRFVAEDICNARVKFTNGCVANLTASRLALKTERKLRVFSPDAYVSLDYQKKYGIVVRRSGNLDAVRDEAPPATVLVVAVQCAEGREIGCGQRIRRSVGLVPE